MKKIISLILVLFIICIVSAVPQEIGVSGYLTDDSGNRLSGTYQIRFNIYDSYSSGTALYSSTQDVTTNSQGFYSVILSDLDINFSDNYYLGIKVETDEEMTPRLNVTSSPYAIRAGNISVSGVEFDSNIDINNKNITTTGSGFFNYLGSLTNRITSLFVEEINASGNIATDGNISANYFRGDGSQLTGISEGIWTNSSGNATFTSGNVGIGTDSPIAPLEIDDSANEETARPLLFVGDSYTNFKFSSGAAGKTPTMSVLNPTAGGEGAALLAGTTGSAFFFTDTGYFNIASSPKSRFEGDSLGTDYTSMMKILSNGDIGIGTTTPEARLDVKGSTNDGSTNLINGQDSDGTDVFNVDTDGNLNLSGDINLPEDNSIKFSGTNIVRANTTSNSIAVGDTSADITKIAITVMGTNAGNGATGDVFVAQGYWAGYQAGDNFVAQGYYAGYNAGDDFAAQGYSAGYLAGDYFAAQGYWAGRQAGNRFAAQGYYAGYKAGDDFVAQGHYAGAEAGDDFTAQGYWAGYVAGNRFAAQGFRAGYVAGSRFAAQGYSAGRQAGDDFAAQGYSAGYKAGNRFIAIGYESTRTDTLSTPAGIDDSIAIGYQSAPQYNGHFVLQQANINSNPLIQGNLNTGIVGIGYAVDEDLSGVGNNGLAVAGNVGIGTTTPSKKLDVNGGVNIWLG